MKIFIISFITSLNDNHVVIECYHYFEGEQRELNHPCQESEGEALDAA